MTPSAQVPFRRFRETVNFSDKRLQLLVVLHPFPLEVLIPNKTDLIQSPDPLFAQTPVLPPFSLGIAPGRKRTVLPFKPASAGIKEDFQRMVFPHPFGVELIPRKTDRIKLVAPFLGKTASFVGDALRVAPKTQFPFRHRRPVVLFTVELDQPLVRNLSRFQLGQDLFDAKPDIRQIASGEERGCSFKSVGRWKIREPPPSGTPSRRRPIYPTGYSQNPRRPAISRFRHPDSTPAVAG